MLQVGALDRYVSPLGGHSSPFADWASAATNIQDAIDVAAAGDTIWVTNGIYEYGGRIATGGSLSNRVALTKALTLRSVNGPEVTIIKGSQTPLSTNGTKSVRCAWVGNGATLSGFTLIDGSTLATGPDSNGGGAFCQSSNAVITNCIITGNAAGGNGGGVYQGTLQDCIVSTNAAANGGGAYNAKIVECTIIDNRAAVGGGVYCASVGYFISDSLLSSNHSSLRGGAVYQGTLNRCVLQGNSARSQGGGACQSLVDHCILKDNAAFDGGGAYNSALTNSALFYNFATNGGGLLCSAPGAGSLLNCSVVGNRATTGAGVSGGRAVNSIIYYNTADAESNLPVLTNCCTDLLPSTLSRNVIASEPMLLSDGIHLKPGSPCIGSGTNSGNLAVDIDNQNWANPPSIGCDEWSPTPLFSSNVRVLPNDI
ncbi:MAG TPA: hypothetical protein VEC99_07105, partial [Clostridia bacterium]|nr:hypothetical protein [Clostridia bacterium]